MTTMGDAVDYLAIPADVDAVAGYIDGAKYPWPADAWAHFYGRPVCRVSVLADPGALAFDSEPGNAPVTQVATAVAVRASHGEASVVYTDESNLSGLTNALAAKSLRWLPATDWPAPGPYLWAASPGTTPGQVPTWCPVPPVAVQDRLEGSYDLSTLFAGWLPPVLEAPASGGTPPSPPPPPPPAGPTYVTAPTSTVRRYGQISYYPTPTLADAVAALNAGQAVSFWTTVQTEPASILSAAQLLAIEHNGTRASTQYVTYTTSPVAPSPAGGTTPTPPTLLADWVLAPSSVVQTYAGTTYTPIPTYAESLALAATPTTVYLWTRVNGIPSLQQTPASLAAWEHTGTHRYPQFTTYRRGA